MRDPEAGWRAVANIAVPTLLVRGEVSDLVSPAIAERMLKANPNIRLTTVKAAGHSVPLDQPDAFASACREFLQGR